LHKHFFFVNRLFKTMGNLLCNYHPRDTQPEKTVSTPKRDKSKNAKKTRTKKTPTPKTTEEPTEEVEEKQAEVAVAEPVAPVVEAEAVVETEAVVELPLPVVAFEVGQKVLCCRNEEKSSGTVVNTTPLTVMLDDAPFGRYAWYWDTVEEDDTFTITEVDEIEETAELAKVENMDKVNTNAKENLAGLLSDKLEAQKEYAEAETEETKPAAVAVKETPTVFEIGQKVICCRNEEKSSGTVVNTNPLTVMIDDAPFGRYAWYWETVAEDNTFTVTEVDEIEEAAELAKVEDMNKVNTDSKANLAELLDDNLEAQKEDTQDVEEEAVAVELVNEESKAAETEETKPAAVAVEEIPKEEVAPVEVETVTETQVNWNVD